MTVRPSPTRVRTGHVAWLMDRLGPRDWAVIETVNRLRLVTGWQLEEIHFADLAEGRSRTSSRSRTLARLVRWRVLLPLPRRIGGPRQGSTVTAYCLDSAGTRLLRLRTNSDADRRIRRPGVPGERFVSHALAISALYVDLVQADRAGHLILRDFRAEPSAWWPDGRGGTLKPDGFATVSDSRVDHLRWVEVDLATESLPTVRRKLQTYLDFFGRGGLGPRGVMPRVLITVPDTARLTAIQTVLTSLPPLAADLFSVALHHQAATVLASVLAQKLPP